MLEKQDRFRITGWLIAFSVFSCKRAKVDSGASTLHSAHSKALSTEPSGVSASSGMTPKAQLTSRPWGSSKVPFDGADARCTRLAVDTDAQLASIRDPFADSSPDES